MTTTARYRAAVEAGDVDAFLAELAPDVVLHSPITERKQFSGHDELRPLMTAVFASLEDLRCFDETGDGATHALFFRARVGDQEVEEAALLHLDDEGRIAELRLWFRPMPGLAALMAALGPKLARSRSRAAIARGMTAPLAAVTRTGDAMAEKLIL